MGVIIYNGKSSRDLHVVVEHPPAYDTPERDYEVTEIPGRNGDIIYDNGSFSNVDRVYEIAIDARKEGFSRTVGAVMSWLRSAYGYARLEDSYDRDYYRMACYKESSSIENIENEAGRVTVTFDCMPQRFLKRGETPTEFTESGDMHNFTQFNAKPTIIVTIDPTVEGILTIGDYVMRFLPTEDVESESLNITLDCDIQDAYVDDINWNNHISGKFPELVPGENPVSFTGITKVIIIPRWWTI